jgi:hypothetical protein
MKKLENRLNRLCLVVLIGILFLALDSVTTANPLPAPPKAQKEEKVDIKNDDVVQFLETLEIFGWKNPRRFSLSRVKIRG